MRGKLPGGDGEPLRAVARLADDNPWRQRLRDPRLRRDRAALERLAQEEAALEQPPALLRWLGVLLRKAGAPGAEVRLLRAAQRRRPGEYYTNFELAGALAQNPVTQVDAIGFFRAALALRPQNPGVHFSLGIALAKKGQLDEAIAEYQEVIRLKKDYAEVHYVHYNLGNALAKKGQLEEAITEYHEAIRLKKDYAEAHCNLGKVLGRQGRFTEALASYRRGHELGTKQPGWSYPSATWVQQVQPLATLDLRVLAIVKGEAKANNPSELLELARFCLDKKKHPAAAARLYADAFAAEPELADDLKVQHRYDAACAAILAGTGQGKDAEPSDDKERGNLRRQALEWLRADLTAYRRMLDQEPDQAAPLVRQRMRHWQQDTDFAGVRGDALAKLPEAEREPWQKLWADVENTLARTNPATPPTERATKGP